MARLARQALEMLEVPRDLLLGRYPEFVTGGPLPRGHVPVFVFHRLDPQGFGRKVRYLADNGYVTLSADEYFQFLMGSRPAPDRAVVLTFDDGWQSVRSVGLPLMERHRMKGIVFVIPGRTAERAVAAERADEGFLTWEEIEQLARSGLFDVQSHSLSHARVHTSPQVAGFMTPELRRGYGPLDVPLLRRDGRDLQAAEVPLGTPLLRSEPRLSEALRFYEDPGFAQACAARVAGEGAGFFCRRGWERELRRLAARQRLSGRFESAEERETAIRLELEGARREIEARIGRPAVHVCYPWHVAGPTARRLAREVGYRTAFCGKVKGVPISLPGSDPMSVARIGEDYVELLPGRGRGDLTSVLRRKLARRLGRSGTEVH